MKMGFVLKCQTKVIEKALFWQDAGWKSYFRFLSKGSRGDFMFHCDYDPKDYDIANMFYSELVHFWADFRNPFSDEHEKASVME